MFSLLLKGITGGIETMSERDYYNNIDQTHIKEINDSFIAMAGESKPESVSDANIRMDLMISNYARMRIIAQALFEVMVEQGVNPDLINEKIKRIVDNDMGKLLDQKLAQPCPKCGKMVKESGKEPLTGRCLHCGSKVKFYPFFGMPEEAVVEEKPVETVKGTNFDDFDEFGNLKT